MNNYTPFRFAQWQDKPQKDRSQMLGSWLCPGCHKPLGKLFYQASLDATAERTAPPDAKRQGRGQIRPITHPGAISNIMVSNKPDLCLVLPIGIEKVGLYYQKTDRHPARHASAKSERKLLNAHFQYDATASYGRDQLRQMRRQREPTRALQLTFAQMPAQFRCQCNTVCQVPALAPAPVLQRASDRAEQSG